MTRGKTLIIVVVTLVIGFGAGFVLRPVIAPRRKRRQSPARHPLPRPRRAARNTSRRISTRPDRSWRSAGKERCAVTNPPMPNRPSSRRKAGTASSDSWAIEAGARRLNCPGRGAGERPGQFP